MSLDVERAKKDGGEVIANGNRMELAFRADGTAIRSSGGDYLLWSAARNANYWWSEDALRNLPAEPDVMRLFDEAAASLGRSDWNTSRELREALIEALSRGPVQRLAAEHGIKVVELKPCEWFGVGRLDCDGNDTKEATVLLNTPYGLDSIRFCGFSNGDGFDTPHACATAILAVLDKEPDDEQ